MAYSCLLPPWTPHAIRLRRGVVRWQQGLLGPRRAQRSLGRPRRSPKGAPEEPRNWVRKGLRRAEEVAVGDLEERRKQRIENEKRSPWGAGRGEVLVSPRGPRKGTAGQKKVQLASWKKKEQRKME
jgi:hypothetical protein